MLVSVSYTVLHKGDQTIAIKTVYVDCSRSGAWGEVAVGVGIVEDGWYNNAGVSELLFDGRHVHLRNKH
jgi:hypothetical protein